jgi:type II secretory pathway pseudopilin PulG
MKKMTAYTIVEIAIVLTVIGVISAAALGSVLPMMGIRKLNEFKLYADSAKEWVDDFVISHRRLPTETEFKEFHPPKADALVLEYKVNPNILAFDLPEMYQGYKPDIRDLNNYVFQKPEDDIKTPPSAPPVDYAYLLDARFPKEQIASYRQIERYYQLLRLLDIKTQQNYVSILTNSLPEAKRMERYNAEVRVSGGVIKPKADPKTDCNLGRDLEIAVGIRAPELWYSNFGSASGYNTWNTLKNLTAAFKNQPGIFEIGTDCGIGKGNVSAGRTCNPTTFEVIKMPGEKNWVKLACTQGSSGYSFKIVSDGVIPPYLKNYTWKFPQMNKSRAAKGGLPDGCAYNVPNANGPLPDSCIGNAYVGEYFFLVVFIRDNNDKDINGDPKIVSKSYRVNMSPLRGSDPAY